VEIQKIVNLFIKIIRRSTSNVSHRYTLCRQYNSCNVLHTCTEMVMLLALYFYNFDVKQLPFWKEKCAGMILDGSEGGLQTDMTCP
jgi:hypothetical protein